MHAVAAPETTAMVGGAKAAVTERSSRKTKNSRPSKIAAGDLLDDSAEDEEPSTSPLAASPPYPADPTLETCCHEPPPIALNPLNSWLLFGEKVLRLPIPATNDIVVSALFFRCCFMRGAFFYLFIFR